MLVLSDKPVANPDSYEVLQDIINELLNVLVNDFPASTQTLAITAITQPPRGSVQISADRQTLLYSPDRGVVSPPADVFTYTISDGTGATSTASVSVFVRAKVLTPMAVDDAYRVVAGSGQNDLHVLDNDLPGVLGTMQITSVTDPATGTAVIDDNGTPGDPLDDFIVYTPNGSFAGVDTFQYTISNANGDSTATVTIFEDPAPDGQTVDLVLEIQDLQGNSLTQINVGEQFVLIASVQDIRNVTRGHGGHLLGLPGCAVRSHSGVRELRRGKQPGIRDHVFGRLHERQVRRYQHARPAE